jgi:Ca-activated chloride channel homolog
VAALDREGLKGQIAGLQPRGFTPIGASLQGAAKDLGSAKQKTVVLVSDGGDNCKPPDPCAVARQISRGGVDLKIQAVGFRVTEGARRQLQCIAKAGGGRYVDASDAEGLGAQLRALMARALRPYITVGEPIEAAPQPEAAQPHPAGRYTTELRPGEEAWYAFAVGAGQAITVSTTLPESDAGIPTQLRTELQSERMEVKDSDLATNSGDVLTAKMDAQAAPEDFRKPPRGHALVRLEADAATGQSGPYPIELTVDVTGEVAEEKKAPAPATDEGGMSAGLAGGLAALVGVALGAALGGLGGRRPA